LQKIVQKQLSVNCTKTLIRNIDKLAQ